MKTPSVLYLQCPLCAQVIKDPAEPFKDGMEDTEMSAHWVSCPGLKNLLAMLRFDIIETQERRVC